MKGRQWNSKKYRLTVEGWVGEGWYRDVDAAALGLLRRWRFARDREAVAAAGGDWSKAQWPGEYTELCIVIQILEEKDE